MKAFFSVIFSALLLLTAGSLTAAGIYGFSKLDAHNQAGRQAKVDARWNEELKTMKPSTASIVEAKETSGTTQNALIRYTDYYGKLTTDSMVLDRQQSGSFDVIVYRDGRVEKGLMAKPLDPTGTRLVILPLVFGGVLCLFALGIFGTCIEDYAKYRKKRRTTRQMHHVYGGITAEEMQLLNLIANLSVSPSKDNEARIERARKLLAVARENQTRQRLQPDVALDDIEQRLNDSVTANEQARQELAHS